MKWPLFILSTVLVLQQECPPSGDDDTTPDPTEVPFRCDIAALDPYVQSAVYASPSDPKPGTTVVIHYAGPLRDAGSLEIHCGFNGWNQTQAAGMTETYIGSDHVFYRDLPMTAVGGGFEVGIDIPSGGQALNFVFHDPNSGTWDNNHGLDYHQSRR